MKALRLVYPRLPLRVRTHPRDRYLGDLRRRKAKVARTRRA
jgi:hypothetical protein